MSTYSMALSPEKTETGSEDSWLPSRSSFLWEGGKKQSGLHSFTIAVPLRGREGVCACVSVAVLYKCVLTSRNNQSQ